LEPLSESRLILGGYVINKNLKVLILVRMYT